MVIQQSINQGLSLLGMLNTLGPSGERVRQKIRDQADIKKLEKGKEAIKENTVVSDVIDFEDPAQTAQASQLVEKVEEIDKKLFELDPTDERAKRVARISELEEKRGAMAAQRKAKEIRDTELARQEADRQREARLKILEGVPLSEESKAYVQKRDEANKGGKPVRYGQQ